MKHGYLCVAASLLAASPAQADTVCEWMGFAQSIQSAVQGPTPIPARSAEHDRAQTQVALAMFEALDAIDRRYESYVGMALADSAASQDSAAATAAYEVLVAHFPSQKAALDESYTIALESVSDARAREAGIAIGKSAASLALTSPLGKVQ